MKKKLLNFSFQINMQIGSIASRHNLDCFVFFFLWYWWLATLWFFYDTTMEEIKYEAEYLNADEFYRNFKVFKENLNEKGPQLIIEALNKHEFYSSSIKVSSLKK